MIFQLHIILDVTFHSKNKYTHSKHLFLLKIFVPTLKILNNSLSNSIKGHGTAVWIWYIDTNYSGIKWLVNTIFRSFKRKLSFPNWELW